MKHSFRFEGSIPERLDRFLQSCFPGDISRSQITRWIRDGRVGIDGGSAQKAGQILNDGNVVVVDQPDEYAADSAVPVDMDLDIAYEDEYLAVVNKPAGIAVHRAPSVKDATLVDGLRFHFDSLSTEAGTDRAGIVHRLDRETSGLLVVAKTDSVHRQLSDMFKDRKVVKIYKAICYGRFHGETGVIEQPIGRSGSDRKKMAVRRDGRTAITRFKVMEELGMFSVLNLSLETGRTHQIRVHLTHEGHPIVGDKLYGTVRWKGVEDPILRKYVREFPRHALHSALISFVHPVSGEEIICKRPFPADLQELLETIRETGRI
ncbi:MAG: RluA family pseudouridine synthase [Desulfuromonadales bacterium]|nr:RluA family pseudouridine synthase [Desulfuromonadales bacterium]